MSTPTGPKWEKFRNKNKYVVGEKSFMHEGKVSSMPIYSNKKKGAKQRALDAFNSKKQAQERADQ